VVAAIVQARRTRGRMPNFLVIGAMKGGTTALYRYLQPHPEVFMPPVKALEFFVAEANWRRGAQWYRRQFAGAGSNEVAIGEASNAYTKYPRFMGVPERIAAQIPDVRMVYVVRDPIDRIRSHYQTRVWQGDERAPIERAVIEDRRYVDYSRYWLQLERYLKWFSPEQFLVITTERLRNARIETLRLVYDFLDIDSTTIPDTVEREFYRSGDHPSSSLVPLKVRKALKRHVPAAKRAKELENRVFQVLNTARGGRSAPPRPPIAMPSAVRDRLASMLQDDVRGLRAFVGPEIDGWGIA
jgi:hypothetical protein